MARKASSYTPLRLRVLIGDDLSDHTLGVLLNAAQLISMLAVPVEVMHLHVEPVPLLGFALSPDYRLDVWPRVAVNDRSLRDHLDAQCMRLRSRAVTLATAARKTGGSYRAELWHGNVPEELGRATEALAADVCIFGRHRFVHRNPLSLGRLSFDAMLKMPGAVLVTPAE